MITKKSDFPIWKTKTTGVTKRFDLNDTASRREYFDAKAGPEIKALREYLKDKTFVSFLMGKKNSGKGTYSKLFMEAIGGDHFKHLSVGDLVRDVHKSLTSDQARNDLVAFLKKHYRGFHSPEETLELIEGRNQTSLISTELIIALIEFELSRHSHKALFIDGFPRAMDQVNYSIYLKRLIGYRDDPDMLVFINVPEAVIDERIKFRVICPKCQTPRNTKLNVTKFVGFDESSGKFYIMCDNPACDKARMVPKEGDEQGIEPIRARLEMDDKVFAHLLGLHGIDKVYLRNSMPADKALDYVDDYELTPEYYFEKAADGSIKTLEKPWTIKDDDGTVSHSLLPAPVAIGLIKQTAKVLGLV
ncbi:MAG TPA: nucleoside monophosphate kinase [Candidatus Paceibacterota bacterium]